MVVQKVDRWRNREVESLGQGYAEWAQQTVIFGPATWARGLTTAHRQRDFPGAVHVAGVVAWKAGAQDHPLHLFHCSPTLCCDNKTGGSGQQWGEHKAVPVFGQSLRAAIFNFSQVINPFETLEELIVPLYKKLHTWENWVSKFRKGRSAS